MSWQHKYAGKTEEATKRQLGNLEIGRKGQVKRSKEGEEREKGKVTSEFRGVNSEAWRE